MFAVYTIVHIYSIFFLNQIFDKLARMPTKSGILVIDVMYLDERTVEIGTENKRKEINEGTQLSRNRYSNVLYKPFLFIRLLERQKSYKKIRNVSDDISL